MNDVRLTTPRSLRTPERNVVGTIQDIIAAKHCRTGLDLGAGTVSVLTALRPTLRSTAIDRFAPSIETSQKLGIHDEYIVGDVMTHDFGNRRFDVVVANELIEHLDKWAGWRLLERLEQLASRLILVTTPNGFVPQGAEHGNPWQRHRSGWFPHDFEGLGYTVHGIFGPKFMRGYAGQLRWRGARVLVPLSELLGRVLHAYPAAHFGLLAVKELEGVAARLDPYD
jgi:hypothetical protein